MTWWKSGVFPTAGVEGDVAVERSAERRERKRERERERERRSHTPRPKPPSCLNYDTALLERWFIEDYFCLRQIIGASRLQLYNVWNSCNPGMLPICHVEKEWKREEKVHIGMERM